MRARAVAHCPEVSRRLVRYRPGPSQKKQNTGRVRARGFGRKPRAWGRWNQRGANAGGFAGGAASKRERIRSTCDRSGRSCRTSLRSSRCCRSCLRSSPCSRSRRRSWSSRRSGGSRSGGCSSCGNRHSDRGRRRPAAAWPDRRCHVGAEGLVGLGVSLTQHRSAASLTSLLSASERGQSFEFPHCPETVRKLFSAPAARSSILRLGGCSASNANAPGWLCRDLTVARRFA